MKITESKKFSVYNFIVAARRAVSNDKKRAFVRSSLDVRAHYGLPKIIIP
jgi:hypothetical protein